MDGVGRNQPPGRSGYSLRSEARVEKICTKPVRVRRVMTGGMDALYRQLNENCAAYLERITVADIEKQLFENE